MVLLGMTEVARKMRPGGCNEHEPEPELKEQLDKRGFMNHFLGGLTKSVCKPWHI